MLLAPVTSLIHRHLPVTREWVQGTRFEDDGRLRLLVVESLGREALTAAVEESTDTNRPIYSTKPADPEGVFDLLPDGRQFLLGEFGPFAAGRAGHPAAMTDRP